MLTPRQLVLAVLILSWASSAAAAQAPKSSDRDPQFSPDGSMIVFSSNRDRNADLYIMDADGSDQRRITSHPGMDGAPAWSPDGQSLAFHSSRDGNLEIYSIRIDGTGVKRWSHDPGLDLSPSWSPDGKRLFYASDREGGQLRTILLATGQESVHVTGLEHHNSIRFSPDGSRVAGVVQVDENWEIAIMHPDGSGRRILASHPSRDSSPRWSRDGRRIAFSSKRDASDWDIYVVDLDGSHLVRLTTHEGRDFTPEWLPDGSGILFASNRTGDFQLYVVHADGSGMRAFVPDTSGDAPTKDGAPGSGESFKRLAVEDGRISN